jgi:lycopene cyclase domain-containing protein
MAEYPLLTAVAILLVVLAELLWLRTGVFRTLQYWVAITIVWAFQVPVDGWLTKLSAPVVIYNPAEQSGLRFPWDIPVEDFGFGWAMVTLTILVWARLGGTDKAGQDPTEQSGAGVRGKR